MRVLDRYLLREFLVPLGYCLSGFLIFWIAFDLFSELHGMQEKHLLARDIAEYYVFKAPEFLILVLPVALLLALLYTLTHLARFNEVTAMRAAGVSLWRLCLPYFAVGLIASVGLFALDEFCVPRTAQIADQILTRHVQRRLTPAERQQVKSLSFVNAEDGRAWQIGIYNPHTGEMINPVVLATSRNGSSLWVYASRAVHTNGVWTFFDVRELKQASPTNQLMRLPPVPMASFPQFSETPAMINSEIGIRDSFDHPTKTHRADIPISEILNYLRLHPKPPPEMRAWIYTKLQGRFAGPCACLVVVLLAAPFAASSGRRNVFVGVAASIFFFFLYYIVQQLGFAFGEAGRLPAWLAAWLPNLAFGAVGLGMMLRVR